MISEWVGAAIVTLLGVLFDRVVITITRSRQSGPVRMLLISMVNNAFILAILVLVWYVDGFVLKGERGQGLVHWTNLVSFFFFGYIVTNLMMLWRVVQDV